MLLPRGRACAYLPDFAFGAAGAALGATGFGALTLGGLTFGAGLVPVWAPLLLGLAMFGAVATDLLLFTTGFPLSSLGDRRGVGGLGRQGRLGVALGGSSLLGLVVLGLGLVAILDVGDVHGC